MEEQIYYCPDHGTPESPWPCTEAEALTCTYFAAELDRRVHDVSVNGNYVRSWVDGEGRWWKQACRNHLPVGEPQIFREGKWPPTEQ
jgi:hypothetical protein